VAADPDWKADMRDRRLEKLVEFLRRYIDDLRELEKKHPRQEYTHGRRIEAERILELAEAYL
jgi:sugar-specific transcriptional regulator TrmB